MPRWLLGSPPAEQELVIAHEQSHLEANDAQLLLISLALVVCMPWNLPLLWQQQEAARAAARFTSQAPQPCGEAALRRVVEGISGHPNYDEMSVPIADIVKRQMPYLSKMSEQGAITAIRFVGVSNDGTDSYSVMQEKGATHWLQTLDDKGRIVNLALIPGP